MFFLKILCTNPSKCSVTQTKIYILQKHCQNDFDFVNSWAFTVRFRIMQSLLNLLIKSSFSAFNLCFEILNVLKLNKYIITYRDALVYIMAKTLMQTFDYTKVVAGQTLKLYECCSICNMYCTTAHKKCARFQRYQYTWIALFNSFIMVFTRTFSSTV